MKRLISTLTVLVAVLAVMAQSKLTPQAALRIERQKAKVERKAAKTRAQGKAPEVQTVRLVVKIVDGRKAATVAQLKQRGARIEGRLGRQVIISLPIDSVASVSKMDAVERIDVGHKPRIKTDKSREATNVSLLNGPTATVPGGFPSGVTVGGPITGKGVTVCVIDAGIDYQHPAFKNADGTSRIKCVYMLQDEGGNPFTYTDPDIGEEITVPGSVYDTPELIATLTTDNAGQSHGTHTASTAAGTLSPQGFGGMAPEADLVLIPAGNLGGEDDGDGDGEEDIDEGEVVESLINFAYAYAQKTGKPVVLSASMNSHGGPHDGTGTIPEAISFVSDYVIPVFSTGNEGNANNYLHYDFTADEPVIAAVLTAFEDDEIFPVKSGDERYYGLISNVGEEARPTARFSIAKSETGMVWQSEPVTYQPGDEVPVVMVDSEDDAQLAAMYEGRLGLAISADADGRVVLQAAAQGDLQKGYNMVLSIEAPAEVRLDLWADGTGFQVTDEDLAHASCDRSAGDWTSTEDVISVGAYTVNPINRFVSGYEWDTSDSYTPGDIASFSSYGEMFNGVVQPLVCAPGVHIVAAVNHYYYEGNEMAERMTWQGYPYDAMDGTSMACPTVSGIVALWLQACPTLTLQQVKDVLRATAVNDDFTAANPVRWGYGKIDAKAGLEYILENITTGIKDNVPFDNLPSDNCIYDLQGRRVSNPSRGLYIQNGRKVIR